jgi:hypothetical protein
MVGQYVHNAYFPGGVPVELGAEEGALL